MPPLRSHRLGAQNRRTGSSAVVPPAVVRDLARVPLHGPVVGRGRFGRRRSGAAGGRLALDGAGPGRAGPPPACRRPGPRRHAHRADLGRSPPGAAGPADTGRSTGAHHPAGPEPVGRYRRHRRARAERHLVHGVGGADRVPFGPGARLHLRPHLRPGPVRGLVRDHLRRRAGSPAGPGGAHGGRPPRGHPEGGVLAARRGWGAAARSQPPPTPAGPGRGGQHRPHPRPAGHGERGGWPGRDHLGVLPGPLPGKTAVARPGRRIRVPVRYHGGAPRHRGRRNPGGAGHTGR